MLLNDMREIVLDLGNGEKEELFGKDVFLTNAPHEILNLLSVEVYFSADIGLPAEEVFINKLQNRGFEIEFSCVADEHYSSFADIAHLPMYMASAMKY